MTPPAGERPVVRRAPTPQNGLRLPPPPLPVIPRATQIPAPRSSVPVQLDDSAERPGFQGWLIIALFFGLVGTWAALAPLDGAVVAEGVVKVDGNRKSVQHREGGIVRQLHVKEGDTVAAGAPLISLDDTETAAGFEVLDEAFVVLKLSEARLVLEQQGGGVLALPETLRSRATEPHVAMALEGQNSLLEARQQERVGEAAIAEERIAQLATQIKGSRAQLAGLEAQAASMREELATLQPLLAKGIVTKPRLLQLERTLAQLSGQEGEVTASIARAEQAISEQRRIALQVRNQQATAIAQELRDVRMRLAEVGPKLASARVVHARTVVRAPYAGRIVGLSVFAVGAVIGPGERLMDIVPAADALVVEARVGVNDITELAAGMPVEVRLTGFNAKTTPSLPGEIAHLSADRLTDPHTGMPYYAAAVRLAPEGLAGLGTGRVVPGLAAMVTIPTRSRTALEYLLDPLRGSFARALHER